MGVGGIVEIPDCFRCDHLLRGVGWIRRVPPAAGGAAAAAVGILNVNNAGIPVAIKAMRISHFLLSLGASAAALECSSIPVSFSRNAKNCSSGPVNHTNFA